MHKEEREEYEEKKKEEERINTQSQKEFLAETYREMVKEFGKYATDRFIPLHTYGEKKGSRTQKLSYPASFKRYFFELYKAVVRTKNGDELKKHCPPGFWLSGNGNLNRRVKTRTEKMKRFQKHPAAFRSRVWRRNDKNDDRRDLFMLDEEMKECTFEPEAGLLCRHKLV